MPLLTVGCNHQSGGGSADDAPDGDKLRGHSVIHNDIRQDKVVFLSFDLEHGGEECSIYRFQGSF